MTISTRSVVIMYSTLTIKSIIISYRISYKGSLYFSIPGVLVGTNTQNFDIKGNFCNSEKQ
jgi:hypothetical protein